MFGPTRSIVARALLLGIATGLRSMMPGAVLAWHQPEAPRYARWRSWPVLRSTWGRRVLLLAGAGELVGDKLPTTPSRLEPGPLVGRLAFGGLAGATLGTEGHGKASVIRGAVSGTVGAAIGNYGGYHARKAIVDTTGMPDPAVAVAEDAIAISVASSAVRRR